MEALGSEGSTSTLSPAKSQALSHARPGAQALQDRPTLVSWRPSGQALQGCLKHRDTGAQRGSVTSPSHPPIVWWARYWDPGPSGLRALTLHPCAATLWWGQGSGKDDSGHAGARSGEITRQEMMLRPWLTVLLWSWRRGQVPSEGCLGKAETLHLGAVGGAVPGTRPATRERARGQQDPWASRGVKKPHVGFSQGPRKTPNNRSQLIFPP